MDGVTRVVMEDHHHFDRYGGCLMNPTCSSRRSATPILQQFGLTRRRRSLDQIRTARIRKPPGRSYPRPNDGKIKYKERGRYPLPAKLEST